MTTTLLFYLSWWCRFRRHAQPVWAVTERGTGFRCPTCGRFKVSPVFKTREVA